MPKKIVGYTEIMQHNKSLGVNVVATQIDDKNINLSLIRDGELFGFTTIENKPDCIEVVLLNKTNPDALKVGTQLLQAVIEAALRVNKRVDRFCEDG